MRLLLYPFDKELSAFMRCEREFLPYDEIIPIAPKSFALKLKDVSCADGGENIGINIEYDFDKILQAGDHILFVENEKINIDKDYIDKVGQAVNICEKIFIPKSLESRLGSENLPKSEKINILSNQVEIPTLERTRTLYDIDVPIIVVYGLGSNSNQFMTQVKISDSFKKDGYKVLNISTKDYGALFDMHPLPDFVYEEIKEEKIVKGFNHYLYYLSEEIQPDVIILCMPHGVMPVNSLKYDGCGKLAYMLSNSMKSDIGIFCTHFDEYSDEYFETMKSLFEYRFNVNLFGVGISSQKENVDFENERIAYLTVDYEYMKKVIGKPYDKNNPIAFSPYDEKSSEELYSEILKVLGG